MESIKLKISKKDWFYISAIGTLFGFFISLFFYFLDDSFRYFSTLGFGTLSAFLISLFASLFITLSNNHILPHLAYIYWYPVSFIFSFLSGANGFLFSYYLFYFFDSPITSFIEPYSIKLAFIIGMLTFLIGLIMHQFISMKYKNELVENEILKSQIKALENELNPHFLFNALNSMSELIYIDQAKAEKSILNLSQFLRNAINSESLIDVSQELQMVQTYVDIENIRFEDKIKLHIKNDAKSNWKIPKFSIQLLVENAIKHGFIGKELNIFIDVDKDITVSNDGKMSETLNFGTGLSNLHNRLILLGVGQLRYNKKDIMSFTIKVSR